MKKKSHSQSGFFNLRVLISSVFCSIGLFLALVGSGAFPAQAQQKSNIPAKSTNPLVPVLFDCSRIHELGIDMQENFRAGATMIFCGEAEGGAPSPVGPLSQFVQKLLEPLNFGTTDVDLVTGAENFPNITQSETFTAANPDNPNQIVVAYNDSRGSAASNISGASVSIDGGNTFVRLTNGSGQSPFANTFGDPVVLYNRPTGTWYTVWIDAGCGTQGLGGYKSTTPLDPSPASWTHYCVHTGTQDDRESGWVDNNPASPFFGRMYISWNDYARGGALFVRYSTDNGATWTNERQLTTGTPFIRDVQITGDLATGAVYVAGMNEGGGGLTTRSNLFYKSTDGGNTWTNTYTGPTFPAPGRTTCPNAYFACMYTDTGGYWRHMGWGEPAALNGVVNYVYASRNTGNGDPGNVFHIRSTDGGVTFGAPLQLNTDVTTRAQWQPNLSVAADGSLLAMWYDERETTTCTKGNPGVPCYRMWARKSIDNGATWLPDMQLSDVVTPLPGQPDSNIIAEYAGDYDYGTPLLNQHLRAWVDGRVPISSNSQQDAFFDREPSSSTPTPTATGTPLTPTPTPTPTATATATATCPPAFSQNFDGVVAPALPAGWSSAASGIEVPWVTSTTTPFSAPNDAFAPDPSNIGNTELFSPTIAVPAAGARLTFKNNYITESTFDGMVLEVSINGGAYADITAGGNAFIAGGYNATISTCCGNPIAGRMAWSGTSTGGYIDSTINMPAAANGQNVVLKWRMASDNSVAATGVRIDNIVLTPLGCATPTPSPTATATATGTATPTPSCTPGALQPWTLAANYPAIIESPAVGSDGTFAYSAAGNVGGAASNGFYRYDPVANSWTPLAPIPTAVYATRGVYAANTNSFYVFGGYTGAAVLNTTQIYNVGTGTWSAGAPMPAGRYFPNLAYYAATGKIYVIGGFDPAFAEANQTWEYDPILNTWNTTRANIPVAMAGSATSIGGQFIYLVGNWSGGTGSTLHYRYDITSNTWALMAPAPVAVYEAAAGAIAGKNYVIGGGNPYSPQGPAKGPPGTASSSSPATSYNSTYLYDIAGDSWSTGPNTNVPHSFTGGATVGTRLLVVAGYNGTADTNTVEITSTTACGCSGAYRVLVVYADSAPPTTLTNNLLAEPGITAVTLFDGGAGTPTLAQLQQYDIVVPWSNTGWSDQTTLGNNLGSYLAGGGIVVALNFDWYGSVQSILGTWATTYTPFNNSAVVNFTNGTLGSCTFAGLCNGVTTLNAFYRETVTLAAGATQAATWNDGSPLMAYKGRAVALSAYLGDNPANFSGQYATVIANAGRLLSPPACATPTPTPTPSPTPTATPTATATATPHTVGITGTVTYCTNPALPPIPSVTMTLTGTTSGSTLTNGSGVYTFSSLPSGGNYTVTPTKAALAPASAGINTVDVIAIQRHFLGISLLTGCKLQAADVNGVGGVNTIDVIAVQRFFLGNSTGIANVGKYQFTPANRSYTGITTNQTAQDYTAIVFGDVATGFVHRPEGPEGSSQVSDDSASEIAATVAAVALPEVAVDQAKSNFIAAVKSSEIDAKNKLVGFQGDLTFDERVVIFQSEPVSKAGLTAGNWNVSGNVLDGPGPIRTLRISAYSQDFTPLSGSGTLFELNMTSNAVQSTPLTWAAPPDNFIFIDADLNTQRAGNAAPGSVTLSGKRK